MKLAAAALYVRGRTLMLSKGSHNLKAPSQFWFPHPTGRNKVAVIDDLTNANNVEPSLTAAVRQYWLKWGYRVR